MKLHDISKATSARLSASLLEPSEVRLLITRAIEEDLSGGDDVTSISTVPTDHRSVAEFVTRSSGVVAGVDVAIAVLELVGLEDIFSHVIDSDFVIPGQVLLNVRGNTREILLAERTALNFFGHLSGVATLTREWVRSIEGTQTQIRDTRKTTPGFRKLEKYAVRMGGGVNHRMSLSDSALIKDNHIAAAGGVSEAFSKVRALFPQLEIEVEVDTLDQLKEMLLLSPDLVLLDNMSVAQCRAAVELVAGKFPLEASGGLTIETARAYAQTGVNYLAVGALTHSAKVMDIGLDLKAEI